MREDLCQTDGRRRGWRPAWEEELSISQNEELGSMSLDPFSPAGVRLLSLAGGQVPELRNHTAAPLYIEGDHAFF
jgi:hypothetical protein